MIFNSLTFLFVMLPVAMGSCILVEVLFGKSKFRITLENVILILVSLGFYGWDNVEHIKVLLMLIVVNYIIGMTKKERKNVLIVGVAFNLFVLIYYKYINMIIQTLNGIVDGEIDALDILAPLGISFIVFHCISYLMDLYNDNAEPCHSIIDFSLYITFFPKLIQGPIVKYKEMKEQIKNRKMTFNGVCNGLERFIIGLAKKVLIADILSITVTEIYNLLGTGMDVGTAWIGTVLFTLQIYFDFSGYSDMAIGLSRMFGFNIAENFNFPYRSKSITEFWKRWHISLGAWFKEYLYFPLGGNRRGNVYINLFIVFLATGIWHGAAWIYLLWGVMHGICRMLEKFLSGKEIYNRIPSVIKWFTTMLIVNIGWICFKVSDLSQFLQYIRYMLGICPDSRELSFTYQFFLTPRVVVIVVLSCVGIFVLGNERVRAVISGWNQESKLYNIVKYIFLLFTVIVCFITIVSSTYSPFLYFQY